MLLDSVWDEQYFYLMTASPVFGGPAHVSGQLPGWLALMSQMAEACLAAVFSWTVVC